MGVLGRYDERKDEVVSCQPGRPGSSRWRYDETSQGSEALLGLKMSFSYVSVLVVLFSANLRCDESSECSSNDDDASDSSEVRTSAVHLTISSLDSLHTMKDHGMSKSTFACNGTDPKRIKEVLREAPCQCGCTMPYKTLQRTCQSFWSLTKEAQDACLWSLQQSGGRKTKWSIEGPFLYKFWWSQTISNYGKVMSANSI